LTWGGCGVDLTGSGQGPVAGCCECCDEPSGSCATELVIYRDLKTEYLEVRKYLCVQYKQCRMERTGKNEIKRATKTKTQ
jgi:hypothetical protein